MSGFWAGFGVMGVGCISILIYASGNAYAQVLAVPAAYLIGMLVSAGSA